MSEVESRNTQATSFVGRAMSKVFNSFAKIRHSDNISQSHRNSQKSNISGFARSMVSGSKVSAYSKFSKKPNKRN